MRAMRATLSAQADVGDLVAERPSRGAVFDAFGIDYSSTGEQCLAEVCRARGIQTEALLDALARSDAAQVQPEADLRAMSLTELTDHIESTHHVRLARLLPRLEDLSRQVARIHGERDRRLRGLANLIHHYAVELRSHMAKEEHVLFEAVRRLDELSTVPGFQCGSIGNPIHVMVLEHDEAGAYLSRIRQVTDGLVAPDWACATYQALIEELRAFEADMHAHVHKENHVLFPRALARERELDAQAKRS
mgnify:CR=1 FL=1